MTGRLVADVYAGDVSWKARAHCGPDVHDVFFPSIGRSDLAARAKEICDGCPVRVDCLEFALAGQQTNYDYGIWGGTTPRERERIRRRRQRRAV